MTIYRRPSARAVAIMIVVLLVLAGAIVAVFDPVEYATGRRFARALEQGMFGLEPERERQLQAWLANLARRLAARRAPVEFMLNRAPDPRRLNVYTERRAGAWFPPDEPFNARYYPRVHAIVGDGIS